MKIEEAKEKLHNMAYRDLQTKPYDLKLADVMQILNQIDLDQPKTVVPQCDIDWVDDSRERDYEFDEWFDPDNQPLEVYKWLNCKNKRQADINALALVTLIVNGPSAVTVEKEKLYTVEISNPNGNLFQRVALCRDVIDNEVFINYTSDPSWKSRDKFQLTEQEIRKDFDWAFRWAEEVTE